MPQIQPKASLCKFYGGPADGDCVRLLPELEIIVPDVANKIAAVYERRSSVVHSGALHLRALRTIRPLTYGLPR